MLVYIQVLRFLAAFAVVAFHAWGVAPEGYKVPDNFVSFVLSWGGRGVDLFFVISGFIIFYATHRANQDAGEFLRRRVGRIVPLYFFVTFANPLFLEFVLGVVVGFGFVERRVDWLALAAAACALCVVMTVDPASRVIVSGIPSACLVAVAAFASRKRGVPSSLERALARLG